MLKENSPKVLNKNADYLLAVKENQGLLKQALDNCL